VNVDTPSTYELPFPRSEYEARHDRVRRHMAHAEVDATIVTMPRDFSWLTGTRVDYPAAESPQWLIVWEGEPVGIVRRLEASTHRCCSFIERWVEYPDGGPVNPYDPILYTVHTIERLGLADKCIGINPRVTPIEDYERLKTLLPRARSRIFAWSRSGCAVRKPRWSAFAARTTSTARRWQKRSRRWSRAGANGTS
jgi:Xaa-Pro aminopeptidase